MALGHKVETILQRKKARWSLELSSLFLAEPEAEQLCNPLLYTFANERNVPPKPGLD